MFRPPSFGSFGSVSNPSSTAPTTTTTNLFGAPASSITPQMNTSVFGSTVPPSPFGTSFASSSNTAAASTRSGTANPPYAVTRELESDMMVNFKSISAMPAYAMKSYEELRLEDYACGRKGPINSFVQPGQPQMAGQFGGFGGTSTSTGSQSLFGKPATSTFGGFGSSTFGQQPQQQPTMASATPFGQPSSTFGSAFGQQTTGTGLFGQPSTANTSLFGQPSQSSSLFGGQQSGSAFGVSTAFGQPSSTAAAAPTNTPFGSAFGSSTQPPQSTSFFGQPSNTSTFGALPFGVPSSSGTAASNTVPGSLFGSQQQPQQQPQQPQSSLFGTTPATAPKPLFGSAPTSFPTTSFGQVPSASTNFFGGSSQSLSQQQPTSTLPAQQPIPSFGASSLTSTAATPSLFGQTSNAPFGGAGGGTAAVSTGSSAPSFSFAPSSQPPQAQSQLFASKPLFPVATAPAMQTSAQQPLQTSSSSLFGSGGNLFSLPTPSGGSANAVPPTIGTSFLPSFSASAPSSTTTAPPVFGVPQLQHLQQSSLSNLQHQFLSIAPPLPPALAAVTIRQPSTEQQNKSPVSAKTQAAFKPISSWRIKLRESSEGTKVPAEPVQQQLQLEKHAVLVPRRFKSLTISSSSDGALQGQPKMVEAEDEPRQASRTQNFDLTVKDKQYGDFFMSPPESVLKRYTDEQLKAVSGFIVGQKGVGQIRFLKPVDLTGISLDDIFPHYVAFEPCQVQVYPEADKKAPPGQGLNQPAEISLERCWPVNRSSRLPITDPQNERYKQHIERLKNLAGVKFVDFVNETGTWTFLVEHFSGYGVPEEYRVVDDSLPSSVVSVLPTGPTTSNSPYGLLSKKKMEAETHKVSYDFARRPISNHLQASFRISFDCFGRLAIFKGKVCTLLYIERDGSGTIMDRNSVGMLINDPRTNPDIALLCDLKKGDRHKWLSDAVGRWCKDATTKSALHAALFSANMESAVKEATLLNRPWLAALLASDCPRELAESELSGEHHLKDVALLVFKLLSGRVDTVAEEESRQNPWLLDYALRTFYSNGEKIAPVPILANSFPNGRPVPDAVSCLIVEQPPVFHPEAFRFSIPGAPDMLLPYLVSREFGLAQRTLKIKSAEQLMYNGLVAEAAELLKDEAALLLDIAARFPDVPIGSVVLRSMSAAWSFRSKTDYEAEFDAWIAAYQTSTKTECPANYFVEQAALVFLNYLADQYVLGGEHGRLSARLHSLSSALKWKELHIYELYLAVRLKEDISAAELLIRQMDSVQVGSLSKRIAFAEMAASCASSNPALLSKYLPPELVLLNCHRILQ